MRLLAGALADKGMRLALPTELGLCLQPRRLQALLRRPPHLFQDPAQRLPSSVARRLLWAARSRTRCALPLTRFCERRRSTRC